MKQPMQLRLACITAIRLYLCILIVCGFHTFAHAQLQGSGLGGQALIDSLLRELPRAKNDTARMRIYNTLAFSYYAVDPEAGLKYGKLQYDVAEKIGLKKAQAGALSNISMNYMAKSDYASALSYSLQSLQLREELGEKVAIESSIGTIATIYLYQSNYTRALEYYFKALKLSEEINDSLGIAANLGNIGMLYHRQGSFAKALGYHFKALKMNEVMNNREYISNNLFNIASVYQEQHSYDTALSYYTRALKAFEAAGNNVSVARAFGNMGSVYQSQRQYDKALEYFFRALTLSREVGDVATAAENLGSIGGCYLDIARDTTGVIKPGNLVPAGKTAILQKARTYSDSAVTLSRENGYLENLMISSNRLSDIYSLLGNSTEALKSYRQYTEAKDSLYSIDKNIKITNLETEREVELKNKQIEINKLAVEKKRNERFFYIAGIILLLLVIIFVLRNYTSQLRSNKLLSKEKKLSDDLLLNILPAEVAEELKSKGSADAKYFDNVTVLFTDFVNFTTAAQAMSPQELVMELHTCFKAFDDIMGKYNIEKIKTIGDAYLAVSGLPAAHTAHAENIVNAAIEIAEFMLDRMNKPGSKTFAIRIGIHSGNVVAGIVGVKKFAYDIWGDTVNTAARMEQNSKAGKINISQTTYELVHDKFRCEYRGEIEAKNKGDMKMYFVTSLAAR